MLTASRPEELATLVCRAVQGVCVTIGNFDGVHIGHQALLAEAEERAAQAQRPLVAVTFDLHPLEVLLPAMAPPRLTDTPTRLRLLEAAGVDTVLLLSFTPDLAALSPVDFVREILINGLCMRDMLIGYDFSLGKDRAGTGNVLAQLGENLGFTCGRFGPVLAGGEPVSSTRIRNLIKSGDLPAAAVLLGRPYGFTGPVVTGFKRGRELGFRTANLVPPAVQLPPAGVYATWARLGIERFPAVTSLGTNPTFDGRRLTVETHLLDFDRDIYGRVLELSFAERLREQIAFSGSEALVRQIRHDIRQARAVLAACPS